MSLPTLQDTLPRKATIETTPESDGIDSGIQTEKMLMPGSTAVDTTPLSISQENPTHSN